MKTKTLILRMLILSILLLIPLGYFIYSAYVTLNSFAAGIYNNTIIKEAYQTSFQLFLTFAYEYFIYIILMLLNYFLYHKKCFKALIILNSIFLIIILYSFIISLINYSYNYDYLIFLISSLSGLILSYKLKKTSS